MITGAIKSQIDQIWNAFWSGGISNPLEVIEQITYLLFVRRLDDLHTLEENKANTTRKPIENAVFPKGKDDHPRNPRPYDDLRWSRFKHFARPRCTPSSASTSSRSSAPSAATTRPTPTT